MPARRRRPIKRRQSTQWVDIDPQTRRVLDHIFARGTKQLASKGQAFTLTDICRFWTAATADGWLDRWVAEKPGSRPWAWWRFNAPEPR